MTQTPPVAVLEGVSRSYGSTHALAPTDLRLDHGIVGLLGPNGAGKSKEWRETGPRHLEVRRVLDLVGLGDRPTRRIRALSGGQRRRLALAQALMGTPELVILDEPTTGLDPEQRASLRGILSGLAGAGCVLLATHQTEDVSALCDRVLVLDAGRIRFDGTPAELMATAEGAVSQGAEVAPGAVTSWRTGTGAVRSVGGAPGPGSVRVEPTVEDAYLLLRAAQPVPGAVR